MCICMCVFVCESVCTHRTLCGSGVEVMQVRAVYVCHCIGTIGEL